MWHEVVVGVMVGGGVVGGYRGGGGRILKLSDRVTWWKGGNLKETIKYLVNLTVLLPLILSCIDLCERGTHLLGTRYFLVPPFRKGPTTSVMRYLYR